MWRRAYIHIQRIGDPRWIDHMSGFRVESYA
jgi:hypothetical protein